MSWDWSYAAQILPGLLWDVWVTVVVTAACAAIALAGGLGIAVIGNIGGRTGRICVRAMVQ
jgi:ABC-type amino acid transport system permease subunit